MVNTSSAHSCLIIARVEDIWNHLRVSYLAERGECMMSESAVSSFLPVHGSPEPRATSLTCLEQTMVLFGSPALDVVQRRRQLYPTLTLTTWPPMPNHLVPSMPDASTR